MKRTSTSGIANKAIRFTRGSFAAAEHGERHNRHKAEAITRCSALVNARPILPEETLNLHAKYLND